MKIEKARKKNVKQLLAKKNVIGIGRGLKRRNGQITGYESIICNVVKKVPLSTLKRDDQIPKTLNGYPTDVIEVGEIKAFETPIEDRWKPIRPAPGGVSVGHHLITAGTLGVLVMKNGKRYILSNAHVLANTNDGQVGDAILQPGPHDGGVPADQIGTLSASVPISFNGMVPPTECPVAKLVAGAINLILRMLRRSSRLIAVSSSTNTVDAAIAYPTIVNYVTGEVLDIGWPTGVARAELGDTIMKSGRTTGLTMGVVEQVDLTVQVGYGDGKVAIFEDQIMAGEMNAPGDSGSAVFNEGRELVGLLFAGSETTTVINRIENVFSGLGIDKVVMEESFAVGKAKRLLPWPDHPLMPSPKID